ncbi:MAG: DUF882 domain-containing protein [Inquilinaceae bacterium]
MAERTAPSLRLGRRRFLATTVAGLAMAPTLARASTGLDGSRSLSMVNVHNGERIDVEYFRDGWQDPDALLRLNHFLRDWRTGEVIDMDVGTFDILYQVRRSLGTREPFRIISGYRSPRTNARLAAAGRGVAKRSYHMKGQAIDIALPGTRLEGLRDCAMSLRAGGVGYYPRSGFVHVDTGPSRTWAGS